MKKKKFTLIINPKSSSYDLNTIRACREVFDGNDCDLVIKEIPKDLQKNFIPYLKLLMFKSFLDGRVPITSGGDGTFSSMQQAYVELLDDGYLKVLIDKGFIETPKVGHLGMGASNDMNVNLGFGKDPVSNTNAIINGEVHPRDIGIINGTPMGYSAIGGLAAHVPYSTPTQLKQKYHVWAYLHYGIYDGLTNWKKFVAPLFNPYSLKVTLDNGEPFEEKAHILGIFKGVQFAGLQLLDSDVMDDGKLNYVSVKNPVDLGFKVVQGITPNGKIDGVRRASKIDIEFVKQKLDYPLDMDGEVLEIEDEIHAEVHPEKLPILMPKRP